jgi:hypothetical protein
MPIDLTTIPNHLKEAAATGNLVPFIGAGVSRQAKPKGVRVLPTWQEFMGELMDLARAEGLEDDVEEQIVQLLKEGKYLMAAQELKSRTDDNKREVYIRTRFTIGAEPAPIHYALFKLKPNIIMTTNYDVLLEDAFTKKMGRGVQPITPQNSNIVQQVLKGYQEWDKPLIFKIHGTATDPENVVFAEQDYQKLIYGKPGYRAVLSAVFVTKVVLMMGFSHSDPEVTMVLQTLREGFRQRSSPDYIVLRKGMKGSVERKRLSQDFGLEVIEYEPSEGHKELCELVEYLAKFVPRKAKPKVAKASPRSTVKIAPGR